MTDSPDFYTPIDAGLTCTDSRSYGHVDIEIEQWQLRRALSLTVPATGDPDARAILSGVLIRPISTGMVEFVAANGFTLVTYLAHGVRVHGEWTDADTMYWPLDDDDQGYSICIESRDLKPLVTKLDKSSDAMASIMASPFTGLTISGGRIPDDGNNGTRVNSIVGTYPDYDAIADETTRRIEREGASLPYSTIDANVSSLVKALTTASQTSDQVAIYAESDPRPNCLTIIGRDKSTGVDTIVRVFASCSETITACVDPKRLLAQLKVLQGIDKGQQITIQLAQADPMVITADRTPGYRAIQMPMLCPTEEYDQVRYLIKSIPPTPSAIQELE